MNYQILILFCINVLSAIGYSLLAPLYPTLAIEKGVEEYIVGIIFSFFAISNIISIPLTPKLINKFGRKNLFYMGIIIEASCTILFGMVRWINNYYIFIITSLFARFCQGIGSGLSSTLAYSIAASLCDRSNLKATMGFMELAYSLGLTVGPILASILFYFNGHSFPFYVCGFLTLLCLPFIEKLNIEEESYDDPNFLKILFDFVK
jgi:DHA1 family multidrug resistance protein-like MFS transporter